MKTELKEKMLREAVLVKVNSYSPYSKFRVGACVALKNGELISGVNVESASYPCGICAERSALSQVYSKGYKKEDIVGMAISADSKDFISPCGMCRQVMSELMPGNTTVYLLNSKQEVKEVKVKALLPFAFDLKESK